MFPHPDWQPARYYKLLVSITVARLISPNLLLPIVAIHGRG